ncbi:MAG: NADAR family protein [Terracidiphilus sp.]
MSKAASVQKQHGKRLDTTQEKQTEIRFYRANEKPYGSFSNLFKRSLVFEEHEFPSAEHAYQAGKASKEVVKKWLLSAPSPSLVAMAAHGLYTWDIVPNWSQIKFDRMRAVLRAKFTQHEDLRALLLSTGSARLVECGTVDNLVNRTWGEVNGKGKNMLGVLLMELRDELAKEAKVQRPQRASRQPTAPIKKSK